MSSYYELLGVTTLATETEIRKAYRLKAKVIHPDVNTSPDAHQKFQQLLIAYETLIDKNKRFYYDNKLTQGTHRNNTYEQYAKYYQQNYYNDFIKKQREKKVYEAKVKHEEFLKNKAQFKNSRLYYPFYVLLYFAVTFCSLFGIGVIAICFFMVYKTHFMFTFFLSPFICGGIYFLKCTSVWYKEAKRYF